MTTSTQHGTPERGGLKLLALCSGVVCHLCFVLGVAAMITAMYFGMSRSLGRVPPPWNWVANAGLLLQFGLAHSLLLSARGRAVLARLAPLGAGATLATTTYVTIAGLQILALFALWTPTGTVWWRAEGAVLTVLTILYASSWLLLGKSMIDAGLALQTGSLGWVALLRSRRPVYPGIRELGLFRFTRQPIYVAFTLTLWAVPTWTPDQLLVALALTGYCLFAPLHKEARYRRIDSAAFEDYARRVPYWLPRLPQRR